MKKIHIRQIVGGLLLLFAISFAGCSQDDAKLKSDVSSAVEDDDIDVDVKDGVVTLKGEVDDPAAKTKAEARARDVEGVKSVDNEIVVLAPPPPAPGTAPASGEMSAADQKLYNEVQAVLTTFPDVRASVNNGVVTLNGEITRAGEILLMPKIKGLFPREIENNLTIK